MTVDAIFAQALAKSTPAERTAYLAEACAHDLTLRQRVETLLQSHEAAGDFLGKPAIQCAAEALAGPACAEDTQAEARGDDGHPEPLDFLTASDKPGSLGRLGHYDIQEVVGRGGMGIVLRSFDEKLHRVVAIKVMAAQLATSATARKRFTREAQAAAAVSHDHVVTIHAVEEAWLPSPLGGEGPGVRGLPYIVMQYVAGLSLQQRIDRGGPLELHEILRIGMQTAAGLVAAHAQGLIHRDIKPANILLENGVERVKITDFGLARAAADASLTQSGAVAGTPHYMAPEQARGDALDARTDLFSLGSVLYAMCTGRSPFRASGSMAVLKRVCEETPTPIRETNPEIPDWLTRIIDKLHAKDPTDRFQTAAEVAELLSRHLAHVQHPSVAALPGRVGAASRAAPGPARLAGPTLIRQRRWAVAAAILMLCLFGGLSLTEATGVTQLASTVIRIFTPEGTLVVEVDDPEVKVTIEGDGGIVITGAGLQEVRLKPGSYKLQAHRDGKRVPLERELVSIAKGGREVVKVKMQGPAAQANDSVWRGWPKDAPLPAVAPFDAAQAKEHQQAWAKHLGVPVEIENSIGMKLRLIPPGEFMMGSPENEPDRGADEAQHEIKITKPFFLGTHLATVGQFNSFVSETGYKSEAEKGRGALIQLAGNVWRMDSKVNWQSPGFEQTDDHPVACLSWNDATAFCDWLSAKEGTRYTLSTEAQWEYACRAGSSSTFFFGDNDQELAEYAWFSSNSAGKTHPVGQKKPNAWGLYDMHGNVYQWTADWYAADYDYSNKPLEDPSGPIRGTKRVLRGGAWCTNERRTRDAFRNGLYAPSSRATSFGLRVALVGDLKAAPKAEPPTFALRFDGNSSHVVVPTWKFSGEHPLTVEAWLTPGPNTQQYEFISNAQVAGLTFGVHHQKCYFILHNGKEYNGASTPFFYDDRRVHVAGVLDGQEVRLYVNGIEKGRGSFTGKHQPSLLPLLIGGNPTPDGKIEFPFVGLFDYVRISKAARYDKDFTPTKQLEPDLDTLALYRFDEGRGDKLADASGNEHHGKIVGAKWVKADGTASGTAAAQGAANVDLGAFLLLGGKGVAERKFDTLAEAVLAASDGDTIEIRGNGPFVSQPIRIAGPSLLIRAGEGFRPVIQFDPQSDEPLGELLVSDAPLVLEGLEIHDNGREKHAVQYPALVRCTRAPLHVANCRLLVGNRMAVGTGDSGCQVRNCEVLSPARPSDSHFRDFALLTLTCVPAGQIRIDNCVIAGQKAFSINFFVPPQDASIRMTRNAVLGDAASQLCVHKIPGAADGDDDSAVKPVQVELSSNLLDFNGERGAMVIFLNQDRLQPEEAKSLLRRLFHWRQDQDVFFCVGRQMVACVKTGGAATREPPSYIWQFNRLVEWKQFWEPRDIGVLEGALRYLGGDLRAKLMTSAGLTPDDFRLRPDSAGYRAGPDGKDLGPDIDLVGPGAGYERWKKTLEYQEWLKETGQEK